MATRTSRGAVRQHSRRTASGGRSTVRRHTRRTRALVTPGHAWTLARRAFRAVRRRRRGVALALGALAFGELAAWLTLRGVFFMLTTAALLALGAAMLAAAATGDQT